MAAITDLTWSQLAAKLPSNSIRISDGSTPLPANAYLDLSALTGDTINELTDSGVVEAIIKLLQAGRAAQTTVNTGQTIGEQLNAFPAPVANTPTFSDSGISMLVSYTIQGNVATNLNSVVGAVI